MKTIMRIGAVAAVLTLAGCVHTNAAMLGTSSAKRPPVPAEQVALYRVASQVPGRYEEVAILNAAGDSGSTNEAMMFESMRKKAGEVGANGVILDALSEPGHGAKVAAAIFGVSAQRKGKALAIYVFPDAASRAPTTPASPVPREGTAKDPLHDCESCGKIGRDF
jgi:hypothetical protein